MKQKNSLEKNKVKELTEELTLLTTQLKKIAEEEMVQCYGELSSAWKGETASLFIQKGENQRKNMADLSRKIKKTTICMQDWLEE